MGEELVFCSLLLQKGQRSVGDVACLHHAARDVEHVLLRDAAERFHIHFALQLRGDVHQALQKQRIERPAFAVEDHAHRFFVRDGFFVHPLVGQGVVYIRQRNHLGLYWDLLSYQSVGVSASVVALVVPSANVARHPHQLLVWVVAGALQDVGACHAVGLHDGPLVGREGAGIVQDMLWHRDLADVVQGRGVGDQRYLRSDGRVAVGRAAQLGEQHLGDGADVEHMHAAFAVAELDDMAQQLHHDKVALLLIEHLLGHHVLQHVLLGVQHHGVRRATLHGLGVEGPADEFGGA